MKIEITIDSREITALAGRESEAFLIAEFLRNAQWFADNSSGISVYMPKAVT